MRIIFAVVCGAIITAYGAAGVLLRTANSDAGVELVLCRYLSYCDDEIAQQELHRLLWSGERTLEATAIPLALECLRRSPASAGRWCTLGDAYLRLGETGQARHAYARALELGPNSPPQLMRAANFFLEIGDTPGFLKHSARVLSLAGDYDAVIFDGYRRVGVDVTEVLEAGTEGDSRLAGRYAEYLSARVERFGERDVREATEKGHEE